MTPLGTGLATLACAAAVLGCVQGARAEAPQSSASLAAAASSAAPSDPHGHTASKASVSNTSADISPSTPTAAATGGSAAVAWGENFHGQLGAVYRDGHEELPVPVEGLNNIQTVVAAESFGLALLSNGTVASWGGGAHGQLGDGAFKATWERGISHSMVSGLSGVTAIAASSTHAMALLENGTVMTWGGNGYGQMGQGVGGFERETGINTSIPTPVPRLKEVTAIAAGGPSDYALLKDGEIEAWGSNHNGQLGVQWPARCEKRLQAGCEKFECITELGPELCSPSPHVVVDSAGKPITGAVAVYAGQDAAFALLKNGEVLSWGSDQRGALGRPNVTPGPGTRFIPPATVMRTRAQPLGNVVEFAAGYSHTLVLLKSGELMGWGNNEVGELGKQVNSKCGSVKCMVLATPISLPSGVQPEAISAGHEFSLILARGKVYAFGSNEVGELGNGGTANSSVPKLVKTPAPVTEISAAFGQAAALLAPGIAPPPPNVTVQEMRGSVKLGWPTATAERLVYRIFERPGPEQFEEPEGPPGEEEEVEVGESPIPKNVTLPRIRHEPQGGRRTFVGQTLLGNAGNWTGKLPTSFTYQWQRCQEAKCQAILNATRPTYVARAGDLNLSLRLSVTAKNSAERHGVTAISEPTSIVRNEGEVLLPMERVSLSSDKLQSYVVKSLLGEALRVIPYEFKLTTDKSRTFVSGPAS